MQEASSTPWLRTLAATQLVLALTLVAIVAVNGVFIPPLVVFAILAAAMCGVLLRWGTRRWVYVLAAVFSGVFLASSVPFFVEDLAHPETFFSFFLACLAGIAAAVSIVGGLMAATVRAPRAPRAVAGAGAALAAVALAVSLVATLNVEADARAAGDIIVVAEDYEFAPGALSLPAGRVGIYIENEDLVRHTFVVEGTDAKQELPGSTGRRLELDLPPGEYRFYCDVPGHENMDGRLTVS